MKKVLFTSLLLIASFCKAADGRYLHLVNEEAWTGAREVAQIASYYWSIHKASKSDEVNLDGYGLETIPSDLGYTRGFNKISLNNNQLKAIPDSRNLPRLRELYLNGNQITVLPSGLRPVYRQEVFTTVREKNKTVEVRTVPEDFCFRLLQRLYLDNNQIQAIPNDFQLRNLEILSLNNNRIQAIDPHVLGQLQNLQELHVEGNYLPEDNIQKLKAYAAGRPNLTIFFGKQKEGLNAKRARHS